MLKCLAHGVGLPSAFLFLLLIIIERRMGHAFLDGNLDTTHTLLTFIHVCLFPCPASCTRGGVARAEEWKDA